MKIKMRTLAAGPNGVMEAGKTYTVSEEEARQLVDGRYAEALEPFPEPEKKTETPVNTVSTTGEDKTDATKPPSSKEDGEVNGAKKDTKSE